MSETTFDPSNEEVLTQQVKKELTFSALCAYLGTEAAGNFRGEARRLITQLSRQAQGEAWEAQRRTGPDADKHRAAAENLFAVVRWLNSGLDESDFAGMIWSILSGKKQG